MRGSKRDFLIIAVLTVAICAGIVYAQTTVQLQTIVPRPSSTGAALDTPPIAAGTNNMVCTIDSTGVNIIGDSIVGRRHHSVAVYPELAGGELALGNGKGGDLFCVIGSGKVFIFNGMADPYVFDIDADFAAVSYHQVYIWDDQNGMYIINDNGIIIDSDPTFDYVP